MSEPVEARPEGVRKRKSTPKVREHGNPYKYKNEGCRCEACSRGWYALNAKARAKRMSEGLPDGDPRHGKASAYGNYGCRCEACTEAWRAARARERLVKRAAEAIVLGL